LPAAGGGSVVDVIGVLVSTCALRGSGPV